MIPDAMGREFRLNDEPATRGDIDNIPVRYRPHTVGCSDQRLWKIDCIRPKYELSVVLNDALEFLFRAERSGDKLCGPLNNHSRLALSKNRTSPNAVF